jgi:hypothetical protein
MHCRICGSERGAAFRERSRMTLCDPCHRETPEKATYETFLRVTGLPDDSTGRTFFDDYRHSTYGPVRTYWASCSSS